MGGGAMRETWIPRPYQVRAVEMASQKSMLLAIEMGLGKTGIALTVAANMLAEMRVRRVLVVAPKRVMESTWPDEIGKWEHLKWVRTRKLNGDPRQRLKLLDNLDADVYLISRDLMAWLYKAAARRNDWPFDMVIVDESTSFKSPDSARFRALRYLRPRIRWLYCLTGTPISNSYLDLWGQMFLVDAGESLGTSYDRYKDAYFTPDYLGYSWNLRPGAKEAIQKAVEDRVLSLQQADYLALPDRIIVDNHVDLPPEVMAAYKELEKNGLLELAEGEEKITATSAAAVANKLTQVANGGLYDAEGAFHEMHSAKLDMLQELLESTTDNVIVVYAYQSDLTRLQAAVGAIDVRDKGAVERWNRGEIRVLALHPASGGYGLNLQFGGRRMVWYGLTWSLEAWLQTIARLHRSGQTQQVIVHRILARGTIDDRIIDVLSGRHKDLAELMTSMSRAAHPPRVGV